jgi:hypothetical protein
MHLDMHLDTSTLDGYLARSHDAPRLVSFDDHVATCLQCQLLVEAAVHDPDRWERRGVLGRLVHVTPVASLAFQQPLRDERRIAA